MDEREQRLREIEQRLETFTALYGEARLTEDCKWVISELKEAWARESEWIEGVDNILEQDRCDCSYKTLPENCPHDGTVSASDLHNLWTKLKDQADE